MDRSRALNNENCHIMLMDVADESLHKISVPHGHRKSVVFLMMGDYLSSISATCLLSRLAIHILEDVRSGKWELYHEIEICSVNKR